MSGQIKKKLIFFLLFIANILILFWCKEITDLIPLSKNIPLPMGIFLLLFINVLISFHSLQLNDLEKLSKLMLNNINEMVFIYDYRKQKYIATNQSIVEMLGYKPKEIINLDSIRALIHPDDTAVWDRDTGVIKEKVIKHDFTPYRSINRFRKKNGDTLYLETNSIPFKKGKDIIVISTCRDITEHIILAQSLQTSEKKYRSLYYNAQVGLSTSYMDGSKIIMANNKFAEMLGYTQPSEVEGLPSKDFWAVPQDRIKLIELLKQQHLVLNYPIQLICKNKLTKNFEIFARYDSVKDYIETNLIDVSEMSNAREKAEAANLAKDQFLANISHEIRTPMIGILGSVDLLEKSSLDQEQSANIATIRDCGEQLLSIINEILNVSKIELGLLTLNPEVCSLLDLFPDVSRLLEPVLREKGLQLVLNLDEKIPDKVVIDQTKLRQILLNILNNAVKFTSKGVIVIDAHIQTAINQNSNLLVSISDTGIGIPQSQQNKIFEAFTQADSSASREFGGTGVGLYICKKLIDSMEGEIWLDSCEGQGTIFHFKIPLQIMTNHQSADYESDQAEAYDYESNSLFEFNPVKILIVEDNELTQKIVGQMLNDYGFVVMYATNGLECLRIISESNVDLVLMDMQMPLMDGYETTGFMREDSELKNIPIIAMTANAMVGDREKCLASGCTDYITKPFKSEELVIMIKKHLSRNFRNKKHENESSRLINDLIPEFIADLKEMIEELNQAVKNKNHEMIKSISHDIKGTAGMYGFMEISETAAIMEKAAQDKSYKNIIALYYKIKILFQQANTKVS